MNRSTVEQTIAQRIEALLEKMTLDQKIGQMTQTERMAITPQEVKAYHIGSVLSGGGSVPGNNRPADWIAMNDAYWAASMEEDEHHLAIPIIYGVDAIHGHNNVRGATIFPHNIGLGAANDPALIERIARATALEILSTGVEWTFAPTLAVARNNHWGRTYESYSEDPDIVQSYAGRFVKGLQGDLGEDSIVGCVKHWVGDGGTSYGVDQGDTYASDDEMTRIHIAPYYPAIAEGVLTVMVSFNSWNGEKCHGHHYLLSQVLKGELGFEGFVISDWDGIDYLDENYAETVALGVNAGIDMFMVSEKWRDFIAHLKNHVQSGRVAMERIDDAVRRILYVKLKYGLFEKPRPAERYWSLHPAFGNQDHRELAREAVRKSLVLLKNDKDILPLHKDARIIVAGKNANDCGHQCGGFTIAWQGVSDSRHVGREDEVIMDYNSASAGVQKGKIEGGTTIWEGIRALAPNAELNVSGRAADPDKHDVGIIVIGETPYAEGMGDIRKDDYVITETSEKINGLLKVLNAYGSSLVLNELHPEDLQAIYNITDKGIPAVVVLVSGRTLVVKKELEAASAFVAAWLPGSEGQGIADVLFGDYDFQGKLSFTWQKNQGENYLRGDESYEPLFPYGYGLHYSDKE
ncbi:MAG: glycoside hydrolase family 3 protein [Bacteroidota bacterium]